MDLEQVPSELIDLARRCDQLMDVFSSRVLTTVQVVLAGEDSRSVELRELAKANPEKFMARAIGQALRDLDSLLEDES